MILGWINMDWTKLYIEQKFFKLNSL